MITAIKAITSTGGLAEKECKLDLKEARGLHKGAAACEFTPGKGPGLAPEGPQGLVGPLLARSTRPSGRLSPAAAE